MLRTAVERWLSMRFALPVVLLCAAAFLLVTESSYKVAAQAVQRGDRLSEHRIALQQVLRLMIDAETAQRGYVITGREDFLEPYQGTLAQMPAALRRVQATQDDAADAAGLVRELEHMVSRRLSEIDTTVRLRRAGNDDNARTLVDSGIGMEQTEALRGLIEHELARSAEAARRTQASIHRTLMFNRLGLGALVVLSALGLSMYMQQVRRLENQRAAQRATLIAERERLEREVATRTRDLRELARHLMAVQEEERAHLARELHDELGALLTAAKLDVARLRSTLRGQPGTEERLQHLTHSLDEGIALKRRIIEDLRPSSLTNLGLRTALDILCRDMGERMGVRIETDLDDVHLRDPYDLAVYRLVQEGLTNVSKHAHAQAVRVHLRARPTSVWVEVGDDGVGFDPAAAGAGRHGLTGMRFRVESLGGAMHVHSGPRHGTTLTAELPLQPDEAQATTATMAATPTTPTAPTPLAAAPQAERPAG